MAIKDVKELRVERIKIDLTGPDGNAYALMAYASKIAKQQGLDKQKIMFEMTSGNYENLISVFDRYFGEYVDLYR